MFQVTLYTDGSCLGNPGQGGYAAVLRCNGRAKEITGSADHTTNNRMELQAVIAGLQSLNRYMGAGNGRFHCNPLFQLKRREFQCWHNVYSYHLNISGLWPVSRPRHTGHGLEYRPELPQVFEKMRLFDLNFRLVFSRWARDYEEHQAWFISGKTIFTLFGRP